MTALWAVAVAGIFVWLGMVVAISFLEAPLKFRAPGVLAGEVGPRSRGHYGYIGLEQIKAIALLVSGILLRAS